MPLQHLNLRQGLQDPLGSGVHFEFVQGKILEWAQLIAIATATPAPSREKVAKLHLYRDGDLVE